MAKQRSALTLAFILAFVEILGSVPIAISSHATSPTDLEVWSNEFQSNSVVDPTKTSTKEFEMQVIVEGVPKFIGGTATAFTAFDITLTYDSSFIRVAAANRLVFDAAGEDTIVSVTPVRDPTIAEKNLPLTPFPDFNFFSVRAIDADENGRYTIGETLIFDAGDDFTVNSGDTVVSETPTRTPTVAEIGKPLIDSANLSFNDADTDGIYDFGELLVIDLSFDGLLSKPTVGTGSSAVALPTCHFYEGCLFDNSAGTPLEGRTVTLLARACDSGCSTVTLGSSRLALVLLGAPIPVPEAGLSGTLFAIQWRVQGTLSSPIKGSTDITIISSTLSSPPTGPIPHDRINGFFTNIAYTNLALSPRNTTAAVNSVFSLGVEVQNVTELVAYDFVMTYDTNLLDGVAVDFTETVAESHRSFVLRANVSDSEGRVRIAVILLNTSFTGTGLLARITMRAIGSGTSVLQLTNSTLSDSAIKPIPHRRVHGFFSNVSPPIASFTASSVSVLAREPVTFNATGSYDPDGGRITSYEWDFGDGATGTGVLVVHEYSWAGSFVVRLTVIDEARQTNSTSVTVVVDPVRDIAVRTGSIREPTYGTGMIATVDVTVENSGSETETVSLVLQGNGTVLRSLTISLGPSTIGTYVLTWNTTGYALGYYRIVASVDLPGDIMPGDNTLDIGTLVLTFQGDMDADFDVDIVDASILAIAFDTRPGNVWWNPTADIDNDGDVDIFDAARLAINFDKKLV